MDVPTRKLVAVGFVLGLLAVPATGMVANWLADPVQQSGTVSFGAASGPTVSISGASTFSGTQVFPAADTIRYVSEDGNFTARGATGSELSVSVDSLDAATVNYTALNLTGEVTVVHETHANLTLGGNPSWFEHRQVAVDDGNVDFRYSGASGSTTVTLRGLPENTRIGFVDTKSNTVLAHADTGGNGVASVTLPNSQHTIQLMSSRREASLSNPSPTGALSVPPSELSVQLNDSDYPSDNHTVEFYLDGDKVATKSANQNKTVTASINATALTGGQHTWSVRATDGYGNVIEKGYSFKVPSTLQIRNESAPNQLVDNTTVKVTFYGSDTVIKRQTDTGTISLEGLPVGGRLIVTASADGYYSRTVVLQSLYQQDSVYLLPQTNQTDIVEVRFLLEDTTGEFPQDSTLYVDRVLNQSSETKYRTVVSDEFGVQGVTTKLQKGERYQIRIRSPDGDMAILGAYTADINETVTLRPDSASVNLSSPDTAIGYSASRQNDTLQFEYSDPADETDYLSVRIYERGNESNVLRPRQTYYDLGNISLAEPLSAAEQNTTWIVEFEGGRDGEPVSGQITVGSGPTNLVPADLDGVWQVSIGVFVLLTSSLIFSELNLGVGAVATSLTGGVLWWLGLLDGVATGATVVLAIMASTVYHAVYRR
jgi:hypothetical protein